MLPVNDIDPGDMRLGIAFGPGNTFYGKQTFALLRYIGFDPTNMTASLIESYNLANPTDATVGPIGVDLVHRRLIGLAETGTSGVLQSANLYDLPTLSTSEPNSPLHLVTFPAANGNQGTGSVDFTPDGTRAFVLNSHNGVMALRLVPQPVVVTSLTIIQSAGAVILSWPGTSKLETATNISGPYEQLSGVTSPYTNTVSGARRFFRLKD